jgi:hypothetical protein
MALSKVGQSYPAFIYLTAMTAGMSPADCSQAYEIAQDLNEPDFYLPPSFYDYDDV